MFWARYRFSGYAASGSPSRRGHSFCGLFRWLPSIVWILWQRWSWMVPVVVVCSPISSSGLWNRVVLFVQRVSACRAGSVSSIGLRFPLRGRQCSRLCGWIFQHHPACSAQPLWLSWFARWWKLRMGLRFWRHVRWPCRYTFRLRPAAWYWSIGWTHCCRCGLSSFRPHIARHCPVLYCNSRV